ncbi:DUF2157 domain-containing protein [Shewanella sp. MEBiC00475]|uniref:DUF2157 domain-containing protein n=1 Tax=Shewanella sp. MEBiC00475 TaxID=2575361 RepID=UPI0010C0B8E3|nr:DUF2157 domain-containing protein [Shewanella sp. MEBiC00475]
MMTQKRSTIWQWFIDGKIEPVNVKAAMLVAYPHPTENKWQQLIANILLYLGVLLLGAGVIFFMAFNWDALSHLNKFAIVETLFSLFIGGFFLANRARKKSSLQPDDQHELHDPHDQHNQHIQQTYGWSLANAMLLGASIMLGALLALVGQTYQTGADPWQLFAIWAVLILPFAYIAGFDLLWLLVVVLLNVSLGLYLQSFASVFSFLLEDIQQIAIFGLVNLVIHLTFALAKRCKWRGQLHFNCPMVEASSLFASVSGFTWLIIWVIFDFNYHYDSNEYVAYYALVYLVTMVSLFVWYRYRSPALYPLTLVLTSMSAAIISLLSSELFETSDTIAAFFIMGIVVVGLTSGCLYWLKKWHQQFDEMTMLTDNNASNSDVKKEGVAHE